MSEQMNTKAEKVVKAGGKKGEAIVAALQANPSLTRKEAAEAAGATVGRVGEVVRWLAANGTDQEKRVIAAHVAAQATKKAAKAAPTTEDKAPAKKAPAKAKGKRGKVTAKTAATK